MGLLNQPDNKNFLAGHNVRLVLSRAPHLMYFSQAFELPPVNIAVAEQSTPFGPIFHHGTKMMEQEMTLRFKVDEDFKNYLEIYNWMIALGFPDGFSKFGPMNAKSPTSGEGIYCDGSMIILSSVKNPNIEVRFERMFPISLGSIPLDTTSSADYVDCAVTFKFQQFYIEKIG